MKKLKQWFTSYVSEFLEKDANNRIAYEVKIEHCVKVSEEMQYLAIYLDLNARDVQVARLIGLLHDIGRFEQFATYQTFRDNNSVDHADLSCKIINRYGLLDEIDLETQKWILYAILHHNKIEIPVSQSAEKQRFLKMIRDADKLDIWRVVCHHYQQDGGHESIGLELPNLPEVTPQVSELICNKKMVHMHNLKTLNDFKLLQMAWVYDLNFAWSKQKVAERDYLNQIRKTMPPSLLIDTVLEATQSYIEKR